MGGIQWPLIFKFGGLHTVIQEADDSDTDELTEAGLTMAAVFTSDPPGVLYGEKNDPRRRDNDICHELGHMMFSDVLGCQYEGPETSH